MAQYMLLINDVESVWDAMSPDEQEDVYARHRAFAAKCRDNGVVILDDNPLAPSETATTIRNGELVDGPFAETKEVLGGYYKVEAPDLDVVLKVAVDCPTVGGSVEVRAITVL